MKASKFAELVNESIPRLLAKIGATRTGQAAVVMGISRPSAGRCGGIRRRFILAGWTHELPTACRRRSLRCCAMRGRKARRWRSSCKKCLPMRLLRSKSRWKSRGDGGDVVGSEVRERGRRPMAALADDATFKASLAQVQKDSVLAFYVNMEGIVGTGGSVAG